MLLGHSKSTSESFLYVCAIICKVNRHGGQDQGTALLYMLTFQPDLSCSWIWLHTVLLLSLESGLGTSVMKNGTENQTIVIDMCMFITFDNISGQCK